MDNYDSLYGKTVIGSDGEEIGKIDNLYTTNDQDVEPVLATVSTGWFSTSSFLPLADVRSGEDDTVVAPYTKDKVKNAPKIDPDEEVSLEEGEELYDYYDLGNLDQNRSAGKDDSATDAMTLSEEEVNVGKRKVEKGRVRIRKYVVTENVQKTIPVQREEVRIEREPVTGSDARTDEFVGDIGEDSQEVVTHAEVPVVDKHAVAKEKVRLRTETVDDETTVNEEARKERLDVDDESNSLR